MKGSIVVLDCFGAIPIYRADEVGEPPGGGGAEG